MIRRQCRGRWFSCGRFCGCSVGLLSAAFGAGLLFAMVCPPRLILILVAVALVCLGFSIITER